MTNARSGNNLLSSKSRQTFKSFKIKFDFHNKILSEQTMCLSNNQVQWKILEENYVLPPVLIYH